MDDCAQFDLYMDDVRPCPIGWVLARTIPECIQLLKTGAVNRLSLDHDMGACPECASTGAHIGDMQTPATTFMLWCPHALDGTHLVRWMVETGQWSRQKPTVHSANPNGRDRMRSLIDQFFGQPARGQMF